MRDSSDRNDYINSVLEQIDDKTLRREIRKELSAHIDDREEYFKDCGYDDETAERMAVERMGPPKDAADGFSKVHNKAHKIISVIFALLSSGGMIFIAFIWALLNIDDLTLGAGLDEAIFLIFLFSLSALGKRNNSPFICFISILDFVIICSVNLIFILRRSISSMCSRIVFKLVCLFTLDFKSMSTFVKVGEITVAPYIICLSSAFYLAVFILLIFIFKSVRTLKEPTYTLKQKHFTNKVFKTQKISVLFIAATMLILPVFGPYDKDEGMTVKTGNAGYGYYITVAQSDTPKSISEIPDKDIIVFEPNYDWSVYIFDVNSWTSDDTEIKSITSVREDYYITQHILSINKNLITKKCGNKFQYKVAKFDIPLVVSKDYVYVKFAGNDSSTENWYTADSIDKITAAIDDYNQVEITFSKAK